MPIAHPLLLVSFAALLLGIAGSAAAEPPAAAAPRDAEVSVAFAAGHLWTANERDGDDIAVVGQIAWAPCVFAVEVELGKTEYHAGDRADWRFHTSLIRRLQTRHSVVPYLAAGIGFSRAEFATAPTHKYAQAELGGGLSIPLTSRLSITGDVRYGWRRSIEQQTAPTELALAPVAEPVPLREQYARWRMFGRYTF